MFKQGKNHSERFSNCVRHDDEELVQNNLAVTPSQMLEMAESNIPISTSNLNLSYQDGVGKLDFEPPIDFRRGVDITDVWENTKDLNQKFKNGVSQLSAGSSDNV